MTFKNLPHTSPTTTLKNIMKEQGKSNWLKKKTRIFDRVFNDNHLALSKQSWEQYKSKENLPSITKETIYNLLLS